MEEDSDVRIESKGVLDIVGTRSFSSVKFNLFFKYSWDLFDELTMTFTMILFVVNKSF